MYPLPFSLGPTDDWDPQGYSGDEDELEDELAKVGMSVKSDDDEEDDGEKSVEEEADGEDADEEDKEDEEYEKSDLDPIAALDDLADQINKEEHETFRFRDLDE